MAIFNSYVSLPDGNEEKNNKNVMENNGGN